MSLSAAQLSEMQTTVSLLEGWYEKAMLADAGTTYWDSFKLWSSNTTADSVSSALRTARRSLDYLKGELRTEVVTGAKPYGVWVDLAQSTRANIQTVLKTVPALSFGQISSNLAEGVGDAAKFALFGTAGLVFVAGIAALFILSRGRA